MSEVRKRDDPRPSLNPFVLQTYFSFETDAPIQAVEQALEAQNMSGGILGNYMRVVKLLSAHNHTIVRLYIWRRRRVYYPTSRTDGMLWEDKTGRVFLEGTAQVDAMSFYGWITLLSIMCFFCLVGSQVFTIVPFFLALGVSAFIMWEFYTDRNAAVEGLQEAVLRVSKQKNSEID